MEARAGKRLLLVLLAKDVLAGETTVGNLKGALDWGGVAFDSAVSALLTALGALVVGKLLGSLKEVLN